MKAREGGIEGGGGDECGMIGVVKDRGGVDELGGLVQGQRMGGDGVGEGGVGLGVVGGKLKMRGRENEG